MKKTIILSLLITCLSTVLCSQNTFVVTKGKTEEMSTKHYNYAAQPGDGLIIINTVIPDIKFEISNGPLRLHKTSYDKAANQYILSVQPLVEEDIHGRKSQFPNGYSLRITEKNYYEHVERNVFVENSQAVYYTIEPKRNFTKITVLGQDNKPLQGAILTVVGSDQTPPSTDLEGVGRIRLNENREYTVEVSHQNYDDTKTIKIKPGEDPQPVRLMKKKPESQPIIALVNVKGHDNQPLSGARVDLFNSNGTPVYAHGTPYYEITKPNGDAPLLLSNDKDYKTGKRYKIKVSHPDYPDGSKSMEVTRTEDKNKPFNIRLTNYNPPKRFNFFSYVVPGLGEFQADRNGEGIFVITSEVVLLGGAGVSYLLSNNYKNTMSKSNVGIDEYNKAAKQYNTMRGVNIVCWSAAAIVYTVHIFRVASLSKKSRGSHAFITPTVMGDDKSFAYGVTFSYTF